MDPLAALARRARPLLTQPYVLRVRRNHALEHATIHMLNRRGFQLSGRSDGGGFSLFGEAPTEEVESAAAEALARMKAGECSLALHPNCGTNLVVSAVVATMVAYLGFAGRGWRAGGARFPTMLNLMLAALFLAMPLGMRLQRDFTTEGELGDMQLAGVTRASLRLPFQAGGITVHRVATRQG